MTHQNKFRDRLCTLLFVFPSWWLSSFGAFPLSTRARMHGRRSSLSRCFFIGYIVSSDVGLHSHDNSPNGLPAKAHPCEWACRLIMVPWAFCMQARPMTLVVFNIFLSKKKVVFNISFQKKKTKEKKKLCSTNWRETREIHFSLDSGMNSGLRYNL